MEEIRDKMKKTWVRKCDFDARNGSVPKSSTRNSFENKFKASSLGGFFQ